MSINTYLKQIANLSFKAIHFIQFIMFFAIEDKTVFVRSQFFIEAVKLTKLFSFFINFVHPFFPFLVSFMQGEEILNNS